MFKSAVLLIGGALTLLSAPAENHTKAKKATLKVITARLGSPVAVGFAWLIFHKTVEARRKLGKRQTFRHVEHLPVQDLGSETGKSPLLVESRHSPRSIACLFVTADPPKLLVPDLPTRRLAKPFTAEDLHRALQIAEDRIGGRIRRHLRVFPNFTNYI